MYHYLREVSKRWTALPVLLLTLCLLTGWSFSASASPAPDADTATGIVKDQTGEPLIGASVLVVGTTNGAATNLDGEFSIKNVKVGSTLRFTYVGCKPFDIKWAGTPLDITLEDDSNTLDEVVVVGFGTQKKVNLTGAVSTVSSKELQNRPVASVADALQGLAPGLDVLSSGLGGQLDGTRTMNIRGTGTIGTGASVVPLVLIDGMEGDINTLNPNDVENISILKDASASSIYGSRAAGGVILITTKNGKEGKPQVNYSNSFRWGHAVDMPEMMDSWTWMNYMNQGSMQAGRGAWVSDEKLQTIKDAQNDPTMKTMFVNPSNNRWEVWDVPALLPIGNTDWLDEHFGKTSFSQEHNVSVSGGNERFNYYFSGAILSREGIMRHGDDRAQRYNVNARINVKITNWLNFGYATRWSRNRVDMPSVLTDNSGNWDNTLVYHNIARYWPIIPVFDPNGNPVVESFYETMHNGGRYYKTVDKLDQQFQFHATPLAGMNIHADFNYRSDWRSDRRIFLQTYGYDADGVPYARNPNNLPYGIGQQGSMVRNYSNRGNYFNPNIYADYAWKIAEDHSFKVMAGFQSEWYRVETLSANRNGIINNLPWLSTTNGTNISVGGGTETWSTAGWFGRINYDYAGRYLVEGNLRYDGTSRFRSGSRWAWSPSFSLGWNIANEAFWEDYLGVCNTLKLRYSWGKLGNQNTNSVYPTYATMSYYATAYGWLVNPNNPSKTDYTNMPGLIAQSLTWEKNRTWDIGLDWGLFNNRLTGTFDYYNRKTEDMVGPGVVLPDVLGTSVPNVNIINMTARGWELTIGWRDRVGDFTYGVTANLYDHKIKVNDYPNPNKDFGVSSYYDGAVLGNIWGLTSKGIAKTQAEMDAHLDALDAARKAWMEQDPENRGTWNEATMRHQGQKALGSGWGAGDMMYEDLNGDGVIDNGENTANDRGDYTVIGNNTPRYSFGLNIDAQWKGFDLKLFFQGVGKRDYWASGPMFFGATDRGGQWQSVGYKPHEDYFRAADTTDPLGPNVDSYYTRPNWGGPNNTATQTHFLQNAAYCRLKNVTLGYTLPQDITRKAYIEKLRVFFSAENVFNITNFTKMGDPELVDAYMNNSQGFGKVYPLNRTFSIGLNITL